MIMISESVTLLSFWVICDVIVISKNIIILPYLRAFVSLKVICDISIISVSVNIARNGREMFLSVQNTYTYHLGEGILLQTLKIKIISPNISTIIFQIE